MKSAEFIRVGLTLILFFGLIGTSSATIEFEGTPFWISSTAEKTQALAFGDLDNDGDLDLAAGNQGKQDSVYINTDGTFEATPSWKSMDSSSSLAVSWGDVDNDGDLDLAASGRSGVRVYLNNGVTLETSPTWVVTSGHWVDLAWGDVDNDGDQDLAIAGWGCRNSEDCPLFQYPEQRVKYSSVLLLTNNEGILEKNTLWPTAHSRFSKSIAWADFDKDGDLDLAVGNNMGYDLDDIHGDCVYLNLNGELETTPSIILQKKQFTDTTAISWVDFDNDGDLDISTSHSIGQDPPNFRGWMDLYINNGEYLETSPTQIINPANYVFHSWADADLDGDPDLASIHILWYSERYMYTNVYENDENDNNKLTRIWYNLDHYYEPSWAWKGILTWGDVDNDGDPDLAIGNPHIIKIFRNIGQYNKPPIADAGGMNNRYIGEEGFPITFDASASFDPDGDSLEYRWDFNNDGNYDTIWSANPTASYTWYDDFDGTSIVEVSDGAERAIATATVTVNNVAPTVGDITVTDPIPFEPVQVGKTIMTSALFTDPGILDSHTAVWDWGDGSTGEGIVDEIEGSGSVTGTHTYTEAGVYTVTLTVEDDDGDVDSEIFQYVVVYDSDGGFVTGGGWIYSPAGASAQYPATEGKATFGFVSKYKKGAIVPTGNTQFNFNAGNINFHSDNYDWLVIAGPRAQYKGTGSINGEGEFKFMLTAIDGDLNSGDDKFRIKIWDIVSEDIVYDNMLGASDTVEDATALGGGSIIIHKAK